MLEHASVEDEGRVILAGFQPTKSPNATNTVRRSHQRQSQSCYSIDAPAPAGEANAGSDPLDSSSDEEPDLSVYSSVNDAGETISFGPSSALNNPKERRAEIARGRSSTSESVRNALIANAALQRQQEARLHWLPDIDGVPTELALHLLNVHWNRQHHTFLLTYRPAIMRDISNLGPNCSRFLLNAIFACSSKFSPRAAELHAESYSSKFTAKHFFNRCDQVLQEEGLLTAPSIPTVVGLLLLGSSYNAKGQISKGWLYTGYALRMVFDLGLHLDPRGEKYGPEEAEIRRRVFWGAFICDKLQGLYLGRPTVIDLRDAHVLQEFNDTYEEHETWTPYSEPAPPGPCASSQTLSILSVSTFKQFGLLARIMTCILNYFYVVGASRRNAEARLRSIDKTLDNWQQSLPPELVLESRESNPGEASGFMRPPNILNLHAIFHSLIILLHRPFISDGHLRRATAPETSWRRCTSAAKSITRIALGYRGAWTLKSAPYLLSYAVYVACTIHVRNAAMQDDSSHSLLVSTLQCLEELCTANPGVHRPVSIIKKLMTTHGLSEARPAAADPPLPTPPGQSSAAYSSLSADQTTLDLDSIFSMFPPQPTFDSTGQDSAMMRDLFDPSNMANVIDGQAQTLMSSPNLFESNTLEDALYGHMNGPILPWANMDYDDIFGNT